MSKGGGHNSDELAAIRGQVQRHLDRLRADSAERLEDYPLARLSRWRAPPPDRAGAAAASRERGGTADR